MNRRTLITVALALGVGAIIGIGSAYLAMRTTSDTSAANKAPTTEQRRVLYWHDPMVPGTKFDKPGKSPFMDMDLVPVYADSAPDHEVSISPNVAQNLGVRIGKVERREFAPSLSAVGSVAFDERRIEVVQSRVSGTISRLYVKAPLEHVKRGQPLAEVVSPEWLSAQQEYLALLDATSAAAVEIRVAARDRLRVMGVPEAVVEELEKSRKVTAATGIYSPIDGVIADLSVRAGSSFPAASALMQINNLANVWVNAQIPEAQISLVPTGSSVQVRANAWPGVSFDGRVIALLPNIDERTRTLTARVEVGNEEKKLVPGMYVSLRFAGASNASQLVVPSEAVIMTGERNAVIVARERGGYDVVDVQLGGEMDGHAVVLSGLREGESVVLSGQFLIDSEASLKATVNRFEAIEDANAPKADTTGAVTHLTSGTITAIAEEDVTMAHDPVPSLNWPSMTMPFQKPTAGLPSDLHVGDRVTFSFIQESPGVFRLHSIAKVDRSTTEPTP